MALSSVTYAGDASTYQFAVTFGYLGTSDVTVEVDGVSVSFTWDNAAQVNLGASTPPDQDAVIFIYRSTQSTSRLVDFTAASVLDEASLDKDSNQLFYVVQEAKDDLSNALQYDSATGEYDANSKRIKALDDGVSDDEAVNMGQIDGLTSTAVAAAEAAQAAAEAAQALAETAETAAELAETNAETAETNAAASAAAAAADEILTDADATATAADLVLTDADTIATAADKVATNADVVLTGLDVAATAADVIATAADAAATAADLVLTDADQIASAASAAAAVTAETNAETAETAAELAQSKAEEYATQLEDTEITFDAGKYSAFHWAQKAEDFALTAPQTDEANEWTAQQNIDEVAITSTSNATAWNVNTAQCALHTLTEDTTISAPSNLKAGGVYVLRVVQAAGIYTLAFNAIFKWGAADTPVAPVANGDVVIFSGYSDGTSIYMVESNRTEA